MRSPFLAQLNSEISIKQCDLTETVWSHWFLRALFLEHSFTNWLLMVEPWMFNKPIFNLGSICVSVYLFFNFVKNFKLTHELSKMASGVLEGPWRFLTGDCEGSQCPNVEKIVILGANLYPQIKIIFLISWYGSHLY